MKTKTHLQIAAALFLGGLTVQPLIGAETSLAFDNVEAINEVFPDSLRKGGGKGDYEVTCGEKLGWMSIKTAAGGVARGTLYSAESYSPDLNFVAAPVTLTFSGAWLDYPPKGSGYVGRFGIAGSLAGALAADDKDAANTGSAIYFEINRRLNTFRLMQVREGVEATLAQWGTQELATLLGGSDSINNIAIQNLDLTLSASAWRIQVNFVSKRSPGKILEQSAEGTFDPAWTAQTWGGGGFIAVEAAQQLSKDATANAASTDLRLGPITIAPAPSFGGTP